MSDEEMLREAIEMSQRLSRRRFLRGSGLALGALAAGPTILAACGSGNGSSSSGSSSGDTSSKATSKGSGTADDNDVYHANWTLYIDDQTPKDFEKATGLKLFYSEEINDNDEYFAKIRPELSQGNPIKPNIITPTFWMAARLIRLGWLDKMPLDQIPNAKNLRANLVKPPWDPTGEWTMPWQSGMTGIAYNTKLTGDITPTVDDLFDPKWKGKVTMLTEVRDTLGLTGLSMGIDPTTPKYTDYVPVLDRIDKAVQSGQIRKFTGNEYVSDLTAGNTALCFGWSGDIAQLGSTSPNLKFVIPSTGGMLWSDTMVIPKGASKVNDAAKWINFVYDPKYAAQIAATVQYVSPVQGVQDELRKMGGSAATLADSPLMFPDATVTARLHSWGNLSEDEEAKFDQRFSKIQGN
jgi:spermidine/putrescine transport system substrate-binding protein